MKKWIKILLSDSQEASHRRLLALLSFLFMGVGFVVVSIITATGAAIPAENAQVLIHYADIFSWICLAGMGFVSATSLGSIIVSRYKSEKPDIDYAGYGGTIVDQNIPDNYTVTESPENKQE